MTTDKQTSQPTNAAIMRELKSLKGMVVNQGKIVKRHDNSIIGLEQHNRDEELAKKVAKEAIDQWRVDHPDGSKEGQKAYNESNGTVTVNKDLLKAIGYLVLALGAVVAAALATKKPWRNLIYLPQSNGRPRSSL